MIITKILLGVIILILGRQIFWLFVAAVGFAIGVSFAELFSSGLTPWMALIIALISGLLGALLAIFLKELAIGFAGFIAGGYIGIHLFGLLGMEIIPFFWMSFFIGGVIGSILAIMTIDWALIILSSLTGAILIVGDIYLTPVLKMPLFIILFTIGVMIQKRIKEQNTNNPIT